MIDGTFVFDGVVHLIDWSLDGMKEESPFRDPETRAEMMRIAKILTGGVYRGDPSGADISAALLGSHDANYELIFRNSPTDMAVVGSLPFGPGTSSDLYQDPDHFIKVNHGFAAAYPDRCVFSGGVEPTARGVKHAQEAIEYQCRELGARLMKFYPFLWRADDEKLAYPLYEKCRELGVAAIQFHMCLPGNSSHDVEIQRPVYLQRVARDFPDLNVIMHHPMPLYFDETVNIAARFTNIYLLLSPTIQLSLVRPRLVQKLLGELLESVGSDRLIYGSEGAVSGNPTTFIKALMDFSIAEDLQAGYGFPQITDEDKKKILGLNLARVLGIDVAAKKKELADAHG